MKVRFLVNGSGLLRWLCVLAMTVTVLFPVSARAADPLPGDACAVDGEYTKSGGPELSGVNHFLVCQGGTWKAILSANALGEVTTIGNQTCASNDYFKYDGTKFICTTGSGASGAIDDLTDAFTDYLTEHNIIMGRTSAAALTAGATYNLFIGDNAGATTANSTATTDSNTAIGTDALSFLTTGHSNTAVGAGALQHTTTGDANIAIGAADGTASALQNNTTGNGNVAIGFSVLGNNRAKSESTAIGYLAMQMADDTATGAVTYNTALGAYALQGSPTAANNTGTYNTAIGHSAIMSITSGTGNTGVGVEALKSVTSGSYNHAFGSGTLYANITGSDNVAIGGTAAFSALQTNTTGSKNVAIGGGALGTNLTKSESTAVGYYAMYYADDATGGAITHNTAVGSYALQGSSTAANNTGTDNTAVGHSALMSATSGGSNTAMGYYALGSNTAGYSNTALGAYVLQANTLGQSNVGIGYGALGANVANHANVAVGSDALALVNAGRNTAIGTSAGNILTTGTDNILIGYDVDAPANNTSNHLNIGDTIFGDLQNDRIRIGGSGTVGAGPFLAAPPTAEVVAAAAVITANACGTVKQINATANRTTNTTDTFTAPTAAYSGCCMDVVNIDTVDTITLDQNAKFFTGAGTDLALAPGKGVRVCSNGTSWYQAGGVSSASAGSTVLSGIQAATGTNSINSGDHAQTWNWQLTTADKDAFTFTENTASTATGHSSVLKASTLSASTATPLMVTNLGAANSFRVNDETGDADTTPFVIDEAGNVGIGTDNPSTQFEVSFASSHFQVQQGSYVELLNADGMNTGSPILFLMNNDVTNGQGQGMRIWAGNGSSDYALRVESNQGAAQLLAVRGDGNVGIGTSDPSVRLTVGSGTQGSVNGWTPSILISETVNPGMAIRDNTLDAEGLFYVGDDGAGDAAVFYGSVTDHDIRFHTNDIVRMIIKKDGHVGIGTTSPDDGAKPHKFAIEDDVTVGSYHDDVGQLQIRGTAGSGHSNKQLTMGVNTGATPSYGWIQSSENMTAYRDLALNPNGGNVGIGTANPTTKLHVASDVEDGITLQVANNATSQNVLFDARRARGTLAAPIVVSNNDEIAEYLFMAYDGNSYSHAGYFGFMVDGTPGDGDMPTRMEIQVQPDGSGSWMGDGSSVPELVIKNNGNVGVSTASPQSTLHVPDGKYAQFEDNNAGAPPGADCDNNAERGRMSIDTTNNRLYICNGATRGWDYIALTN